MEKEFIPYEEALALKELGFDEKTLFCYFPNPNHKLGDRFDLIETAKMLPNQIKNIGELIKDGSFENTVLAPLYQQAFRWFRDKYNLDGWVVPYFTLEGKKHSYLIMNDLIENLEEDVDEDSFEDAQLTCLRKLIKIAQKR